MIFYIAGCLALGLTTGFLIGVSNSPVVQYVLPLLFALTAGSAGVMAAKSARAKSTDDKLRMIGVSTFALAIPFLAATVYGSLVRTGASIASLLPRLHQDERTFLSVDRANNLMSEDLLKIAIIDRNLTLAGVGGDEKQIIVQTIIDRRIRSIRNFENSKKAMHAVASGVIEETKNMISAPADEGTDYHYADELFGKTILLRGYLDDQSANLEQIINVANDVKSTIEKVMDRPYIYKNPNFQEKVSKLFVFVQAAPSDEIVNADLRKELASLVQNKKEDTDKMSGNFPFLAVNPRATESRI